ncbi:CobW family GTP-binding protein [Microvirga sp. M2]|uniref:CobW family GTP-binding protein n=1 Tax=Microvirga sp. M2 TaxID=3073270 RepID=UPI0039C30842
MQLRIKGFAMSTLPVIVIGGYLGAGKTTLINRLLRNAAGRRIAVLVNEFGELAIDADLIEGEEDGVIGIAGGCVCCSYGSDLVEGLRALQQKFKPNILLIEASGVGLPAAIAQTVELVPGYRVRGVVVLLDAGRILAQAADLYLADTVRNQARAADLLLLNKADVVDGDTLDWVRLWAAEHCPGVPVVETTDTDIPVALLLDGGPSGDMWRQVGAHGAHGAHIRHFSQACRLAFPIEPETLARELAKPDLQLARAKGIATAASGQRCVIQVTEGRWQIAPATKAPQVPDGLVCIRRDEPPDPDEIERRIHLART